MLLVMDVGNTNTVIGLYDGDALCGHWRVMTHYRTTDELHLLLSMLLEHEGYDPRRVNACCISSVVPQINVALLGAVRDAFGVAPMMVEADMKTGVTLQVDNPKEVGADRIVNLVAVMQEYGGPAIVVDFGTATTFDALTEKGEYPGGVIAPGVQLCADILAERCAKLPKVEITQPESVIGKNTLAHIRSGLTFGYVDMVDGLIARMSADMGCRIEAADMKCKPKVIATGGVADAIAALSKRIECVDPWLTLKGLKAVYRMNKGD